MRSKYVRLSTLENCFFGMFEYYVFKINLVVQVFNTKIENKQNIQVSFQFHDGLER